MMPIVHGNSILVTRNLINPERVLVVGGRFPQLEEMTMGAAELLRKPHPVKFRAGKSR